MNRFVLMAAVALGCVFAGSGETVMASRFGWNGADDTAAIQKAIDSGAAKVVIDRQTGDWIVRPLFVKRSNVEIVLEDGVTIRAKKDEFRKIGDSLVTIRGATNVVLRGEGAARLVMNKQDYLDRSRYAFSEWRMGVAIGSSANVTVKDLEIVSSGGDGVYVNGARNVLLERLVCRDHNRQGISIIAVNGLTVRDCRFERTVGALPMAGLDIEPNNARNYCENVLFERCDFSVNATSGVIFCLSNFTSESRPISVTMRDCTMTNNAHYGVSFLGASGTNAVRGTVTLERCRMAGNGYMPLLVRNQTGAIDLRFKDCEFDARNTDRPAIRMENGGLMTDMSRIAFENARVLVDLGEVYEFTGMTGVGLVDITGALAVEGPRGSRRITAAELMKRHPSRPELRTFAPATPDWKRLRPAAEFRRLEKPVATPFFRYRQTFVQYVPGAGEYPIVIRVKMHGKAKPEARVKVYTPGADVGEFAIDAADRTYVIKATSDRSNFYVFDIKLAHSGVVSVESPWPGCGTLAGTGLALSGVGKGLPYLFCVGEGAKSVQAKISPAGGEPASALLIDPTGAVVAEQPYRDAGTILRNRSGEPVAAGLWTLRFPKVYDDCVLQLGGEVSPVVSFSRETALVY